MRKDTDSRRGKPTTTPGRDAAELRRQKAKPTWDGGDLTSTPGSADAQVTDTGTPSGHAGAGTRPGHVDPVPTDRDHATDTEPGTLYPSGGAATRDSADDLIAERTSADEQPATDELAERRSDRPLDAEFRTGAPRTDGPDTESRTGMLPGAGSHPGTGARVDDEPRLLASGDTLPEEPVPGVSDTRTAADREVDAARSGHHGGDALRESGLDGHPTADPTHRAGRVEDTHRAHGDTDPAHRSGVADDDPGLGGPVPEEPTAIGSAKVPGAMTPDPKTPGLNASHAKTADGKTFGTAPHDAVPPSDAVEPLPTPAEPARRLWTAGTSEGLHERWQALQLRFVDDPSAVAGEARTLVDEAIRTLTAELTHRQRELDAWNDGTSPDTEQLRVAVQRYRDFFTFLLTR